jgi:uncharacterized protein YlxW (UPF0749 family)
MPDGDPQPNGRHPRPDGGPQQDHRPSPVEGRAHTVRRRVVRSLTRPGRGQLIAAVILFLVAIGGVAQVRSNNADQTYSSARQDDLVQILDGLNSESRRLQGEVEDLEQTRQNLRSGVDRERVARSETRQRLEELGILAGTVPAEGPGVRITVTDPRGKLSPDLMVEAVEELRDSGAEVIEIDNQIRVVASTSFTGSDGHVLGDGELITSPVVIEAIGDSDNLASGAEFRGGFADQVTGTVQGDVRIAKESTVMINSLHRAPQNQYAQPASSPSGRR